MPRSSAVALSLSAGQAVIVTGIDSDLLSAAIKLEDFAAELVKGNGCTRGKSHRIARGLRSLVTLIDGAAERLELL